ncbi:MAG TPA: hypothetical protein VHE30_29170 [Polyangiaceae bacterium]|nr:hypothetical protein [Polyangiaceae bacterium]
MRRVRRAAITGAVLSFAGCGETVHSLGTLPDEGTLAASCFQHNTEESRAGCGGTDPGAPDGGSSASQSGSGGGAGAANGGEAGAANGGGASTGGATDAGEEPPCPPRRSAIDRRGLNLLLLVDASPSVVLQPVWTSLTAAISRYVSDAANAGIGLGVTYYGTSCSANEYATPTVPIADLPGNAAAINQSYPLPIGGKPVVAAIQGASTYVQAIEKAHPERTASVVLVTDGVLDPVCGSTPKTAAAEAARALAASPSVATYVVALGAGPTLVDPVDIVDLAPLDDIAKAGGTGTAERVEVNLSTNDELTGALESVTARARPCSFRVPPAFEEARVSIEWRDPLGNVSEWPHVASAAACGTAAGVYGSQSTGFLDLCPTSCSLLRTSPNGTATALEACAPR